MLASFRGMQWAGYPGCPGAAEMEALSTFRVPPNCRRLVHRWRNRQRVPDLRKL
jgi:hypothetical protein